MVKIQNTLAMAAPGNDTMKASTQLLYSNYGNQTQQNNCTICALELGCKMISLLIVKQDLVRRTSDS